MKYLNTFASNLIMSDPTILLDFFRYKIVSIFLIFTMF